jgi:hypothetical protein
MALMTGTITRLFPDKFSGVITGDDGQSYWFYGGNIDSFGPQFSDLTISMRVRFTPVTSTRPKDDDHAVDIVVIAGALNGI